MTNSPAELSLECVDNFLKNIIKSAGLEAHLVPVSELGNKTAGWNYLAAWETATQTEELLYSE